MNLERQCPRVNCGGQVEYDDTYAVLEAACLLCGRNPLMYRLDRTPPERAEQIEASLIRQERTRDAYRPV